MATRSVELFAGHVLAEQTKVLFNVPADKTVIVKTAYGYSYGYNTGSFILLVHRAGLDINIAVMETTSGKGYRWDGWFVLEPGDSLRAFYSADVSVSLWISGALLEGVG